MRNNKTIEELEKGLREEIYKELGNDIYWNELVNCRAITIHKPQFVSYYKSNSMPSGVIGLVTMNTLSTKYTSSKPGNIILNAKNLIYSFATVITTSAGIINDNILIKICSFLLVWKELKNSSTIEISKEDAYILYYLWKVRNNENLVKIDDGFNRVKDSIILISKKEISRKEFEASLDRLYSIGSIELIDGNIRLIEECKMEI